MNELILAILATYGVSTLVAEYNGPFGIFEELRKDNKVFECTVCLSVWIAIFFAIVFGVGFSGFFVIIGGIIILDRLT